MRHQTEIISLLDSKKQPLNRPDVALEWTNLVSTKKVKGEVGIASPDLFVQRYFHSHILETVSPEASTSYSKAPQALLSRASFLDAVLKYNMPR